MLGKRHSQDGFTLIEIMVVIIIIGCMYDLKIDAIIKTANIP